MRPADRVGTGALPGARPGPRELANRCRAAVGLAFSASSLSVLAVLLAAVEGALPPLAAWLAKLLVDTLSAGGTAPKARTAALGAALVGLAVIGGVQRAVTTYAQATMGRAVRLCAKDRLLRRVNAVDGLGRFEDPRFLDQLRLAAQSGEQAPDQVLRAGLALVQAAVRVGGFVAALAAVWPPMALLAAVAAGPTMALQLALGRRRAELAAGLAGLLRRQMFFQSILTEARAAKEVRLFGIGDFLRERLLVDVRRANEAEAALSRSVLRTELGLEVLGGLVATAGITGACALALHGALSLGDVTVFLAASTGVHVSVVAATAAAGQAYQALLLFGAYTDIVGGATAPASVRPQVDGRPTTSAGSSLPALARGIELHDVWFRYTDDGPWVLRGVSFTIPHRATVGLVGLNGAGKSTLVKLLCRMYEPQHGRITWDGLDIAEVDPAQLRRRITAVFQDFMTYDMTAGENIALGDVSRIDDDDAITFAARAAAVHDDLVGLPHGYRTLLSRAFLPDDAGAAPAQLSGGQWQRVAVARAFLRDADLLILDEPTSGLDAEAEAAMHERLRTLRRDRTGLLISHRLGALREADLIVVLADGRVAEQGRHDELMGAGGAYAGLFRLQARGYQDEVAAGAPSGPGRQIVPSC